MSNPSTLNRIWANKPGNSLVVAEIWIDNRELWFVIFIDELDRSLKIEVFPVQSTNPFRQIDFAAFELLIDETKRDLLIVASRSDAE